MDGGCGMRDVGGPDIRYSPIQSSCFGKCGFAILVQRDVQAIASRPHFVRATKCCTNRLDRGPRHGERSPSPSWVARRGTRKKPSRISGANASRGIANGIGVPVVSDLIGVADLVSPISHIPLPVSTRSNTSIWSRMPLSSRTSEGSRAGSTPSRANDATCRTSSSLTATTRLPSRGPHRRPPVASARSPRRRNRR